jgi:hypothetical protein
VGYIMYLSTFHLEFCWLFLLLSFCFVVFLGRKDDICRLVVLSSFQAKRRQDDEMPSEKTTN